MRASIIRDRFCASILNRLNKAECRARARLDGEVRDLLQRGVLMSGHLNATQSRLLLWSLLASGITAAHSLSEYAGSVERAMNDASGQLTGLARRTAADLPGE